MERPISTTWPLPPDADAVATAMAKSTRAHITVEALGDHDAFAVFGVRGARRM